MYFLKLAATLAGVFLFLWFRDGLRAAVAISAGAAVIGLAWTFWPRQG